VCTFAVLEIKQEKKKENFPFFLQLKKIQEIPFFSSLYEFEIIIKRKKVGFQYIKKKS
jgi:hypothetical protein